jgi:predicted nucleotidyltransferase
MICKRTGRRSLNLRNATARGMPLEQDLEELLGRPVEILTDGGLSPYLQQRILAEAASL